MTVEKRKYPRVAFDLEDGFIGDFRLSTEEQFTAMIINISGGGMGLAVPRLNVHRIESGHVLILKKIVGATHLEFLSDIPAEIKWIRSLNIEGYMGAGCEFQEITDPTRRQLIQFVDAERSFRGQYD